MERPHICPLARREGTTVIDIAPGVGISEQEITFSFDRTPGPGGQNANKVNTRVTLLFDVAGSRSLSNQQKGLIRQALASRINQDGVLRVASSKGRTQLANRRAAVNRLVDLLTGALESPKPRKMTKAPASTEKKRLELKARQGLLKRFRQTVGSED